MLCLRFLLCDIRGVLSELSYGTVMGAHEVSSGEHRTQETLSTEIGEMLPVRLFFLWLPEPAGAGEGSWKQLGVSRLWEFKAQRLGPVRPVGQAAGFLFVFGQMAQLPVPCLLSGCSFIIPGNHSSPSW